MLKNKLDYHKINVEQQPKLTTHSYARDVVIFYCDKLGRFTIFQV